MLKIRNALYFPQTEGCFRTLINILAAYGNYPICEKDKVLYRNDQFQMLRLLWVKSLVKLHVETHPRSVADPNSDCPIGEKETQQSKPCHVSSSSHFLVIPLAKHAWTYYTCKFKRLFVHK